MDLDSTIEKTISQIQKLMNANSIAGNPIPAGDRIIIPISKTALGFGVGVASNAKKDEDSALGGAGGGGSIDPIALLVVYNDVPGPEGVEILPLDNMGTPLEDLLLGAGKALTGFLGNVLSYARLLALALSTGGIAMTVNILTGLVDSMIPFVGIIIAIIIFIGGHIANLAFQSLGAFINALRLHYVEYFAQFYIGGSEKFRAFRTKRKLTDLRR